MGMVDGKPPKRVKMEVDSSHAGCYVCIFPDPRNNNWDLRTFEAEINKGCHLCLNDDVMKTGEAFAPKRFVVYLES